MPHKGITDLQLAIINAVTNPSTRFWKEPQTRARLLTKLRGTDKYNNSLKLMHIRVAVDTLVDEGFLQETIGPVQIITLTQLAELIYGKNTNN
jgi:hypothetical protein